MNSLFVCLFTFFFTSFCLLSLYCFLTYLLFISLLVHFLTYVSTSLRIGPFRLEAGGRRRRRSLVLVFLVHFMLWYILLWMHVCFRCVWFSFSALSQEIGWEERRRNDLFCVGWDVKPLINQPHPPGSFIGRQHQNALSSLISYHRRITVAFWLTGVPVPNDVVMVPRSRGKCRLDMCAWHTFKLVDDYRVNVCKIKRPCTRIRRQWRNSVRIYYESVKTVITQRDVLVT